MPRKKPTDAKALMDTMAASSSLDTLFAKHPDTLTMDDLKAVVVKLREERVAWLSKEDKSAAKKEAKEDGDG